MRNIKILINGHIISSTDEDSPSNVGVYIKLGDKYELIAEINEVYNTFSDDIDIISIIKNDRWEIFKFLKSKFIEFKNTNPKYEKVEINLKVKDFFNYLKPESREYILNEILK